MNPRRFALSSALILTLSLCVALSTHAAAQTALPYPYAPWQAREDNAPTPEGSKRPMDRHAGISTRGSALPRIPDRPVITPLHTMDLMSGEMLAHDPEDLRRRPSALELYYATRIVDELPQFGYDLFEAENIRKSKAATGKDTDSARTALPAGVAQDDFVLSSGDSVSVTFTGQRQDRKSYEIDNQGLLIVEGLAPITAAGRTLAQIRGELESAVSVQHNIEIFVSLDGIRQIDVIMVGHVKKPGRQTMTVYHSVLDALMDAGGVEKTGSLRNIRLVRDGRSTIIDLYGLLIHGSTVMEFSLRDGDRIVVPPIGPTVAVAGGVKRPGIYESLPGDKGMKFNPQDMGQKLSLQDLLDMAGGLLNPGQNRYMRLGVDGGGGESVEDIGDRPFDPLFGDGSILMVAPSHDMRLGTVELAGHTRQPGIHDIEKAKTLSALIDSERVFGPDIYPLIGVIERRDSETLTQEFLDFPPLLVIKGQFDRMLQDGDIVHLFSRAQIKALQNQKAVNDDEKQDALPVAMGSTEDPATDLAAGSALASFLEEHRAIIRGAVRHPGAWPVSEGASLETLIASAGGMTLEASASNIEVTSTRQESGTPGNIRRIKVNFNEDDPADVIIGPGDAVRVNQKFERMADKSVLIIGEVEHPGRYDLLPGDTMAKLMERAGGLTAQAYPDGAIFSRESERKAEESRFRAAARDLERALAAAMEKEENAPDVTQIAMARDLASELRGVEAVGRITVEADPAVLKVEPEVDILLEAGDRIFIPKRPLTVRVNGEILSPANLQFRKEKDPRDYIMEAGGFTYNADKDRAFVLYPDGSAQPLLVNSWNHRSTFVPPGSTIVVPRDPKPFDFVQSAKDLSQILSNLAITGIFLDDIRSDN